MIFKKKFTWRGHKTFLQGGFNIHKYFAVRELARILCWPNQSQTRWRVLKYKINMTSDVVCMSYLQCPLHLETFTGIPSTIPGEEASEKGGNEQKIV